VIIFAFHVHHLGERRIHSLLDDDDEQIIKRSFVKVVHEDYSATVEIEHDYIYKLKEGYRVELINDKKELGFSLDGEYLLSWLKNNKYA
jgi:hypothetical protein